MNMCALLKSSTSKGLQADRPEFGLLSWWFHTAYVNVLIANPHAYSDAFDSAQIVYDVLGTCCNMFHMARVQAAEASNSAPAGRNAHRAQHMRQLAEVALWSKRYCSIASGHGRGAHSTTFVGSTRSDSRW